MKRTAAAIGVLLLCLPRAYAPPAKSEAQLEQEKAWRQHMTAAKAARGQIDYFEFLGLPMAGPKAKVQSIAASAADRMTADGAPAETEGSEILAFKGNHRLGKVKATILEFFQDKLIQLTLRFEAADLDITYEAVLQQLENKYDKFKPGRFPGYDRVREFAAEQDNVVSVMTGKGKDGAPEVVVIVRNTKLLDERRQLKIDKEKQAIGVF